MREALIIGGSGALGGAAAVALAESGFAVCLGYGRNREPAEALAETLTAAGHTAEVRQVDLRTADLSDRSRLDALILAAGAELEQPWLSETPSEALAQVTEVELIGTFRAIRSALPALRTARGCVVALTSAGVHRWPSGDGLSVIPKAGLEALVRGLAREEGRYGVRANAVAVGVVDAGMFRRIAFPPGWEETAKANIPLGRFGQAQDVGQAVAFLCSEGASYLTGQTLRVDGGYAI